MPSYEMQSSQFGLVSGIHQPASDMVLVAEPSALFAPEARKGRLYIVAETSQDVPRSHQACQLVMNTIRKLFYQDKSYSITASLRKAIIAANKTLYEQNFHTSAAKRAFVGVSCIVIKDHDVYIAQVAPSQAYLLIDGKLRAMPVSPSWSDGQDGAPSLLALGSIGMSLTIEPDFYRAVLRPGDTVVACSSGLARMLGREQTQQLLRSPDTNDITARLLDVCKQNALPEAHGVAISARTRLNAAAQAAPLSRSGVGARGRMLVQDAGNWIGRMTGEAALLVRPGVREQQHKAEQRDEHSLREQAQLNQVQPEPPPEPSPRPLPLELGESLDERVHQERQERLPQRALLGRPQLRPTSDDMPASAFLGEGEYTQRTPEPVERRIDLSDTAGMGMPRDHAKPADQPGLTLTPTMSEQLLRPFERAGNAVTRYGRRRRMRRPPPSAMPKVRRRSGLSYRREGPPFPWLLLLLLVLSVTLLVVYGKGLMDRQAKQEAANLLQQAEVAVAQVRNAPDDATAQIRLDQAAEALALVRGSTIVTATAENQQQLASLQRQYDLALAALQKISYLDDLTEVARHPQASAGATFSTIVVPPPLGVITNTAGFESIYALDANQGMLFRIPKQGAGGPEPFLSPDQPALEGLTAGKTKAIAWRTDNIVAVTQSSGNRFLYAFIGDGGWSFSNLGGSEEWPPADSNRLRLATYEGNLYFINALAGQGQVLKYVSGRPADLYEPWIRDFGPSNTENATDLAVDGKVYLLLPDGSIQVFAVSTFERELTPPVMKPPLAVATSFFVGGATPDDGAIFLIDTANERIVQIDKQSGTLIQQIKVRADTPVNLRELSAVALDVSGPQPMLYLANGGQIFKATLPNPPRALREPNAAPTAVP